MTSSIQETITELLRSTKREGIEDLIKFLDESDFYTAPASTKYHNAFEQGLAYHSLNVYFNLKELCDRYKMQIPEDSIIICGLLHDLSKVNFYEKTVVNKKVYSSAGSKHDEMGNYDWVSQSGYKIKDIRDRFVGVEHCVNSALIAEKYIKLTTTEFVAVSNHHFIFGNNLTNDISEIYSRYPLAYLLHAADMNSVFILENEYLTNLKNE